MGFSLCPGLNRAHECVNYQQLRAVAAQRCYSSSKGRSANTKYDFWYFALGPFQQSLMQIYPQVCVDFWCVFCVRDFTENRGENSLALLASLWGKRREYRTALLQKFYQQKVSYVFKEFCLYFQVRVILSTRYHDKWDKS